MHTASSCFYLFTPWLYSPFSSICPPISTDTGFFPVVSLICPGAASFLICPGGILQADKKKNRPAISEQIIFFIKIPLQKKFIVA